MSVILFELGVKASLARVRRASSKAHRGARRRLRRPSTKSEMVADVRSYLRSTQKRPDIVRNYFNEEHVRYAA
ncbi:MAG: hypothetical protein ACOY58_01760 [Candidatus Micrarchaeota archaeon]